MRLINKSIYALALASMMGLWSCSQDEMMNGGSTSSEGKTVRLTLSVSRTPETRTILSEDGEGGLLSEWKTTDKIGVMIPKIGKVGELGFVEFPDENNKSVAVFSGELEENEYAQLQKAMLYYCDESVIDKTNSTKKIIRIPLHNQKFHSVAELSAMDVLYEHVTLNVKDQVATVTKNEVMKPVLALAHFDLSTLPENSEGTLYVSQCDEGKKIKNLAWIRTYDSGDLTTGFQDGSITELQAEVKKDHQVYMALPAQYSGEGYHEVTLSFRYVEKGTNAEYVYSFTQPTRITAGVYYNSFEDGESSGINLPLKKVIKNPLEKWAETNLEKVSDAEYYKGKFAASYADDGNFYQFGRNVGFENYKEAADCAFVYSSAEEVSAGRGDGTIYDNPNGYYTADNLKEGQRTMGFMIPCYNGARDWWPSTATQSDNWDARATSSGYTPSDLYVIDGVKYKVPTIADYKEIMPTTDVTTLTTTTEVKTIDNKFVAFRWKKVKEGGAYYLQIKAKVVASKTETVSWDSTTDKEIVTRYFKAAGFIFPKYFAEGVYSKLLWNGDVDYKWASENPNYTYTYNGIMYAASALPFGNNQAEMTCVSSGVINNGQTTDDVIDVRFDVTSNFNKYCGRYWTSDGSRQVMSFVFDDDKKLGLNQFTICASQACAYSLRLIKAE